MIKINNYPRPQLVRNNWICLDGEWGFAFDDENIGEKEEYFNKFPKDKKILVPFTYETVLSGINDEKVHEIVWYSKNINLNKDCKRKLIHFEGSDFITKLWVNGKFIGKSIGGYHRFSFDITEFIVDGSNNITVKVEDSLSKSQPRGKQRYIHENFKCWYVQTTGIWKTVWIETVPTDYITYIKNTPLYDEAKLELELNTNISLEKVNEYEVETLIKFDGVVINNQKNKLDDNIYKYSMNISKDDSKIKEWSPDNPNLYDIEYRLYRNNVLIDEVFSYFGIRKISIEGNKIFLNNQELYLRMILDQGYWKESHLTPPREDSLLKDLEIVKKFGYNGIRKHQKIEDERFLYYCDKLGMLVWSEMANCYDFNNKSIEHFTNEWIEVVKQNYNHPSIITWVPINESWGIKEVVSNINEQNFANSLYYLTKAMDNTRPVISNDGWEHTISDIITIHDYKQDPSLLFSEYNDQEKAILNNLKPYNTIHKLFSSGYCYNGQPVVMSEYGGISLNSEGWFYGKHVANEDEFLERFEGITKAIKQTDYICGFCYTQLTDVQQEINGLVNENRNDKFSEKAIKRIKEINEK